MPPKALDIRQIHQSESGLALRAERSTLFGGLLNGFGGLKFEPDAVREDGNFVAEWYAAHVCAKC